jgi:hypothetical protein
VNARILVQEKESACYTALAAQVRDWLCLERPRQHNLQRQLAANATLRQVMET